MSARADLRQAFRLLRLRPGLAVPAVLALALGIGANSAIFSAVHAVLLAPFPFAAPERLAVLWKTQPELDAALVEVSYPEFREWRRQCESFAGLGAVSASAFQAALTGRERPLEPLRRAGLGRAVLRAGMHAPPRAGSSAPATTARERSPWWR